MPYSLVWLESAIDELAEVWLFADDRASVTAAIAIIESRLTANPATAGHEISEGLWKAAEGPLAVYFSIDAAKHSVEIGGVRQCQIGA